jgi:hypothetical protein
VNREGPADAPRPARRGTADDRTPARYQGADGFQPWDVIDLFRMDFYVGTAVAYLCRYSLAGSGRLVERGDPEDLEKAEHYIQAAIERARKRLPAPGGGEGRPG